MWKSCPDGGFYAKKRDQEYLITPTPNLEPLEEHILGQLPARYQELDESIVDEIWLKKHVTSVVRDLRKKKKIVAIDFEGRFGRPSNPLIGVAPPPDGKNNDDESDATR